MAKTTTASTEVQEMIERAHKAQEQRRAVKDISTEAKMAIPQKDLIRQFAPECLGKGAKFHAFWGRAKDAMRDNKRGYEPICPAEMNGEQLKHEDLLAWKLPMDLHMRDLAVNRIRSATMLGEVSPKGRPTNERIEAQKRELKANPLVEEETYNIIKPGTAEYEEVSKGAAG